jgi:hypothetical protein
VSPIDSDIALEVRYSQLSVLSDHRIDWRALLLSRILHLSHSQSSAEVTESTWSNWYSFCDRA